MRKIICIAFIILTILVSCSRENPNEIADQDVTYDDIVEEIELLDNLLEDKSIYDGQMDGLIHLYVTIAEDQSPENGGYGFDFNDVDEDVDYSDDEVARVRVVIQDGDELGPLEGGFGYELTSPNAALKLRGHSTRGFPMKSYKITFDKKTEYYNGYRKLNLNKHPFDVTRLRNKLSFDILRDMENLSGLRTDFVRLYVKDLTSGSDEDFEDYGLYTMVEEMDKYYLQNHGLDPEGNLYKAEFFEFLRYEDELRLSSDVYYDKDKFEEILEIKNGEEHGKLLDMLDAVNDYSKDINDVIDAYFNRQNFVSWLAFNILVENGDTNSQNFYLYSPSYSIGFYFLPWDYDGSWGYYGSRENYDIRKYYQKHKLSNYWNMVLVKRFVMDNDNLIQLSKEVDRQEKVINDMLVDEMLASYLATVSEVLLEGVDAGYLKGDGISSLEDFYEEFEYMKSRISENKKAFYKDLELPMPVWFSLELNSEGFQTLYWDKSYDMQNDEITYKIQLMDDLEGGNIIKEWKVVDETLFVFDELDAGFYYGRLMIEDSKGNVMLPFNYYKYNGDNYEGVFEIKIN